MDDKINIIWKQIKDYENLYEISNTGLVRSLRHGSKPFYLKPINSHGYQSVHLCNKNHKRKNHSIHRLVAEHFIPNPKNLPQVNHKDGNKVNNDVNNLEWCSSKENINHSIKVLHKNCRKVRCIETNQVFDSINEASKFYNRSQNVLVAVLRKYKYNHTFAGYHWEYEN